MAVLNINQTPKESKADGFWDLGYFTFAQKTIHFDASDRLVWVKTVYQKPSWQTDYTILTLKSFL